MQRLLPSIAGHLEYYGQCLTTGGYKLEEIIRKEIPEGKLYVEDSTTVEWHRHLQKHGPTSEAYAAYNIAVIELEERIACLK